MLTRRSPDQVLDDWAMSLHLMDESLLSASVTKPPLKSHDTGWIQPNF